MLLLKKQKGDALSDRELINHYKGTGESHYLGVLFQRYTHLILGVCLKYLKNEEDSKDAVMDIYEHLTEALLRHEVTNFKSWLHSTTKNYCLMKLRREKAQPTATQNLAEIEEIFVENPDFEHLNGEAREDRVDRLKTALSRLKPAQKTCIELFYLEGKSYQEIVEMTGYTLNQVKSYIQNGKRNLKNIMTEGQA